MCQFHKTDSEILADFQHYEIMILTSIYRQGTGRPTGFQGFGRSISMPAGSENQSDFASKHKSFGLPNQQGTRPRGFGAHEETGTTPKGFGAPPQKENVTNSLKSSDLDSKCDISIRSNGLSKVFSGSGEVLGTGYLTLNGSQTENDGFPLKSNERLNACFAGQKSRNYNELLSSFNKRQNSSEEEFYINRDLPENCPW